MSMCFVFCLLSPVSMSLSAPWLSQTIVVAAGRLALWLADKAMFPSISDSSLRTQSASWTTSEEGIYSASKVESCHSMYILLSSGGDGRNFFFRNLCHGVHISGNADITMLWQVSHLTLVRKPILVCKLLPIVKGNSDILPIEQRSSLLAREYSSV